MLNKLNIKHNAVLIIVFCFSTILRLIGITSADLWRDEAFSVRTADQSLGRTIEIIAKNTAPPLHSILLHFWIKLFGVGELSVRLPSLIFGLAALIIFIKFAQLFFKTRRNVLLATVLFAINPVLIWYSQEARAYSMLVFFAIASLYYSLLIIKEKEFNKKNVLLLFITTILGLYTHNLFIFIAFFNYLIALIFTFGTINLKTILTKHRKFMLRLSAIYALAGIIYLPWFIIMLKQLKTVSEGGFWLHLSLIRDPIVTIGMIYSGHYFDNGNNLNIITASLLGVTGALLLIASTRIALKRSTPLRAAVLVWFWGIIFTVWLYSFKTSFFYIRYLLFLIPPALLLSILTLDRLKKRAQTVFLLIILVIISTTSILISAQVSYIPGSKENMSALVRDLNIQDGDLILHADAFSHHAFKLYSSDDCLIYNPDNNIPYYAGLSVIEESDYYRQTEIDDYNRVWVVYLWGQREEVTNELEKNYYMSETYNYDGNLHMELWEKIAQ